MKMTLHKKWRQPDSKIKTTWPQKKLIWSKKLRQTDPKNVDNLAQKLRQSDDLTFK